MKRCKQLLVVLFIASISASSVHASWPYGWRIGPDGDPRADILPHPIYDAWRPYRSEYNRPRYLGGYLAYHWEPTSQEAMSWDENRRRGMYRNHHCPTPVSHYYFPKPWEVLPIGARKNEPLMGPSSVPDTSEALPPYHTP